MRRARLIAATVITGLALVACSGNDVGDESSAGRDEGDDSAAALDTAEEGFAQGSGEAAGEEPDAGGDAAVAEEPSADVDPSSIQAPPDGRHVIYNVNLEIETDNLPRSTQQAIALAESSGGFVSREDTHGDDTATLTLRVPTESHASIVGQLENLGEVRFRSRHAEDVTAEVVDVDARVESQQRSIARVRELLDEAAGLSDVVSIEAELARREANLDSLLARQSELGSLTSLATIVVTFYTEGEEPPEEETELPGFLDGLSGGWYAFSATVSYVGAGLGAVLPFLGVAAVIGVPIWVLRRRSKAAGAKLEE